MRYPEDLLVKICGVANFEDAILADELGADIIGVVLDYSYARHGTPELVSRIHESGMKVAAVYTSLEAVMDGYFDEDLVQLHFPHSADTVTSVKRETGKQIISVIYLGDPSSTASEAVLHYQAGAEIVLVEHKQGISTYADKVEQIQGIVRTGIAGKISPFNAQKLIHTAPLMVDVSSSIEQYPGKKDPELLRQFFRTVEEIDAV